MSPVVIGVTLSAIAFSMGIWLTFFTGSYLRASERYATFNIYNIKDSPAWRVVFRIFGCGILAFTTIYIYAIFHQHRP